MLRTSIMTLAIMASITSLAQEKVISQVLRSKARGSGPIMKTNELAGYYSFYEVDKVDGKTRSFRMALMDNSLNDLGEIKLNRPKNSFLMESVFNGSAFMFFFLNDKNVELETYDVSGKKMGEKVYEDVTKWERTRAAQAQSMGDVGEVNQSIFPIGDEGFLKQSITKGDKRGYHLASYNNDLTVRWETDAPSSPLIESLDIVAVTEDHIIGYLFKQKNLFDMPETSFMVLFDVRTGKKLWEKELKAEGKRMTVVNVFPIEGSEEFLVVGEYFGGDDNVFKDKSTGMYSMRMGADGTPSRSVMFSWEKDILPHVPADEKGKKDMDRIFVHKVVRLSNGSVHFIGEEYKKVIGATGGCQMTTKDMFVIELDPELKLKSCTVYPKSKSRFEFEASYAAYPAALLAKLIKQMGLFDYEFTTQDKAGARYYSSFVDYDRSKNESGGKVGTYVGTIVGNGVDAPTVDKMDVNASGSTYFRAMIGKPGYVLILEYRKKLKQLKFRLEKVNY